MHRGVDGLPGLSLACGEGGDIYTLYCGRPAWPAARGVTAAVNSKAVTGTAQGVAAFGRTVTHGSFLCISCS